MKKMNYAFFVLWTLLVFSQTWADTWTTPETISDPLYSANPTGIPAAGVDAQGNTIAIWTSQESSLSVIRASRFDAAAQTWSAAEQIGSDNAIDARIAVTSDGKAIAVWTNLTSTPTVYANIFDGNSWTGEIIIDSNSSYQTQYYPKAAVDDFGRALIVWQVQGGNLARVIRSSTYLFQTNSWSPATNISTDYGTGNAFVAQPIISINPSGTAVALWIYQDTTTPQHKIQANRYAGGLWLTEGNEENIATSTSNTTQFTAQSVTVAPNGNAVALWAEYDATTTPLQQYTIQSTVRNISTAAWSAPLQISATGNADISKIFTDIAVDSSGDAVGVWLLKDEGASTPYSYLQASAFPQLAWSTVSTTISDPAFLAFLAKISLDSVGDGYVTWTAFSSTSLPKIQAAKYTKSFNSWDFPQTLSEASSTNANQISTVVADAQGDFFALWYNADSITSIVVFQASRTTILPQPPSNFIGKVIQSQFLNSTIYTLEATWNASPSENIIFYRIYKNNQIVAEIPVGSPLLFVKLFCTPSYITRYKIAAVTSGNLESEQIDLQIIP